jgi:hypothetical protein
MAAQSSHNLDDFIDPDLEIKTDLKENKIDRKTKIEVEKLLMRAKQNLEQLKTLLHKSIL